MEVLCSVSCCCVRKSAKSLLARQKADSSNKFEGIYKGGLCVVKCTPESRVANVGYHEAEDEIMINVFDGLSSGTLIRCPRFQPRLVSQLS